MHRRISKASLNGFVCLDDITKNLETLNTIIYVPNRNKNLNKEILYDVCSSRFGFELTSVQLESLVRHDSEHLDHFIAELRYIISKH